MTGEVLPSLTAVLHDADCRLPFFFPPIPGDSDRHTGKSAWHPLCIDSFSAGNQTNQIRRNSPLPTHTERCEPDFFCLVRTLCPDGAFSSALASRCELIPRRAKVLQSPPHPDRPRTAGFALGRAGRSIVQTRKGLNRVVPCVNNGGVYRQRSPLSNPIMTKGTMTANCSARDL